MTFLVNVEFSMENLWSNLQFKRDKITFLFLEHTNMDFRIKLTKRPIVFSNLN